MRWLLVEVSSIDLPVLSGRPFATGIFEQRLPSQRAGQQRKERAGISTSDLALDSKLHSYASPPKDKRPSELPSRGIERHLAPPVN